MGHGIQPCTQGGSVKDFQCPAVFCIHACITDEM